MSRRTRMGQRIYDPEDFTTTKAIAPVAYATTWGSGAKSMRIKQTEIIGKLNADSKSFWEKLPFTQIGDYSAVTIPINPANPNSFPWLSYIARLYDKYRFHSLRFRYINAVPTSQNGNIAFALDYDTLDEPPQNIIHASQLAKYQIGPTYCPQEFNIPVNHPGNNPWLYTFDVNVDTKTIDMKTYNLGNVYLIIDGVPHGSSTQLGWVAVDYDVELLDKNPVVNDAVFASKTWDLGLPAAKKSRSNVDPADTMEVTVDISGSPSGPWTVSLLSDLDQGTLVRSVVAITNRYATPTVIHGNVLASSYKEDSENSERLTVFNVESEVGENGLICSFDVQSAGKPGVPIATAYTYA